MECRLVGAADIALLYVCYLHFLLIKRQKITFIYQKCKKQTYFARFLPPLRAQLSFAPRIFQFGCQASAQMSDAQIVFKHSAHALKKFFVYFAQLFRHVAVDGALAHARCRGGLPDGGVMPDDVFRLRQNSFFHIAPPHM